MRPLIVGLLALAALAASSGRVAAQTPFLTDDAEVTPRGHWNFEYFNEYAVLPRSAFPDHWQETNNFVVQYGLLRNLELDIDFPIILINRYTAAVLPDAFGFGDLDFAAKYKFFDEDLDGWRPGFAASFAVEVPSGNPATQLGSGYTDLVWNTIGQKRLSETVLLHVNVGYQSNGNTLTGAIGIRTPGKIVSEGASVHVNVSPTLLLGADINGAQIRTAHKSDRQLQFTVGGIYALGAKTNLDFAVLAGWYDSPKGGVLVGMTFSP
jgi:hypothetical protein